MYRLNNTCAVCLWSWCILISLHLVFITEKVTVMANSGSFLLSGCTCVGDIIMFGCTAVGFGATIWKGSAFNCRTSLNQIQLLHSQFLDGSARGTCNNGRIVGYATDILEVNHFSSRLDVQVTSAAMNGTTIECDYDDGAMVHSLHRSIIVLTTEPLPPPVNILLSNVRKGQLEFSWDPVAVTCGDVRYNIRSVNCGKCPTTTSLINVTCNDVKIINHQACIFEVSTIVCSNIVGRKNTKIVQLDALDISLSQVHVTPTYDNDTRRLTKLNTKFMENRLYTQRATSTVFNVGSINDAASSYYTINYTDSDTGKSCGSANISATSCINGSCSHEFEISSSVCPLEADFIVTIFGTNVFGNGKVSSPIKRDYINTYVEVNALPEKNSVICSFSVSESNSMKLCQMTYYDENCQHLVESKMAIGLAASLTLENFLLNDGRYCFMSTASNSTLTVNITGNYVVKDVNYTSVIISSLLSVLLLVVALYFAVGVVLMCVHAVTRGRLKISAQISKQKLHKS